MSDQRTFEGREAAGRAAIATALGAAFAIPQLEAQSARCLFGSGVPTLALWANAWYPLPDLLAWLAAMGWVLCLLVTVTLAAAGLRRRVQLAQARPAAVRIARLHWTSPDEAVPRGSTLLVCLAVVAGTVLCLHALAPRWLRADVVQLSGKAWMILFAGALGCRYLEGNNGGRSV